jgi:hypothetical protein
MSIYVAGLRGHMSSVHKVLAIDNEIARLETELESLEVGWDTFKKLIPNRFKGTNSTQAAIQEFIQDIVRPIAEEYQTVDKLKYNITDGAFAHVRDDITAYGKPDGQWLITRDDGVEVYLFYYKGHPYRVSAGVYKKGITLSVAYEHRQKIEADELSVARDLVKSIISRAT